MSIVLVPFIIVFSSLKIYKLQYFSHQSHLIIFCYCNTNLATTTFNSLLLSCLNLLICRFNHSCDLVWLFRTKRVWQWKKRNLSYVQIFRNWFQISSGFILLYSFYFFPFVTFMWHKYFSYCIDQNEYLNSQNITRYYIINN